MFDPKNVIKSRFLPQKWPEMTVFYPKIRHFNKNTLYKVLTCDGQSKSTITHKSSSEKSDTVVNWEATEVGEFALYVTIVQSKSTIWVKEKIGTVIVGEVVAESTVRSNILVRLRNLVIFEGF